MTTVTPADRLLAADLCRARRQGRLGFMDPDVVPLHVRHRVLAGLWPPDCRPDAEGTREVSVPPPKVGLPTAGVVQFSPSACAWHRVGTTRRAGRLPDDTATGWDDVVRAYENAA